ncbi:MAG TPA: DEAD/DEAH box helicase [Thermoanaerobaculia bacterium]|nr:DEAD/DEAH box helicase [Thermoanaerobaculia bacterium]
MALEQFHPVIRRWFSETLGEPTPAQSRGWDAIRGRSHTLIAAPTGSGKTLAAFLTALDDLFQEALSGPLPDEVRIVYVSPLKALSADIHKNLAEPRRGIRRIAEEMGLDAPRITAAVRTGDTTAAERAAMLRRPPHILVTTPESLYLLLTAERSREMLRTARTVIVDEIHAVIGTRRGAHFALTLERLQQLVEAPLLRLGLSATQKPIEEVARFLTGSGDPQPDCAIVDEGHRRAMDLGLETPRSLLETVISHEVWEEYYDRLTELISAHRTTLVFVNTRRMAERIARHLSDRLGDEAVTAHHGSLSKEKRLDAEGRLKGGRLKALVATASLELGIDIGSVDLVCQIGSPHRIATLLQRVGRSGHTVSGMPKGRLFPVSRDDLVECTALLRSVRRGELDRIVVHDAPLDVLAQQIVAETSCLKYVEDDLFSLVRRAWPYRSLTREAFDSVITMVAEGFATPRGRRAALVHRDEVHDEVRGRRGARMLSITSGGAIPEVADYRVLLAPEETFIGTLNEDFAIESTAGDIFQLGNASWQVLQVGSGVVRVADAKGAPPTLPFWLGEAPARSDELSLSVSDLRSSIDRILQDDNDSAAKQSEERALEWLVEETGITPEAAREAVTYLAEGRRALGAMPTQQTLVLERFFDESGGMQLVLHAPFGSRINKAWGLALRKRFCRQFNFELQAAATEDAVLLSLGPQHSFPLADVFRYLHPATARDVLVQAFLDAPVFQTRWRWNTTISLAVPRNRGGSKVPPQLQRTIADDLLAAVFPDAAACFENIPGDRQIPDHPLVNQTVRDCLEEAMDFDGLAHVLERIHRGDIHCIAVDTPEPSSLSHEILNARPYAFLDDAPLEERRTQAIYSRRASDPSSADELGALDSAAIERVRDEERPDPRDADELHDALLTAGFLTAEEVDAIAGGLFEQLAASRRACRMRLESETAALRRASTVIVAAERLPELRAVHPGAAIEPPIAPPASRASRTWTRAEAIIELVRGRLTIAGPVTARSLAESFIIEESDADAALFSLESEGAVLRGGFTAERLRGEREWCDRRLLARIHRYTLVRLRAEIEPVSPAELIRFLFAWQGATPSTRLSGIDGLHSIIGLLDGFEIAAAAWERSVLPLRVENYDPSMLDTLCFTGEVGWARLSAPAAPTAADAESPAIARIVSATPVALFLRQNIDAWQTLRFDEGRDTSIVQKTLGPPAQRLLDALRDRGASFLRELAGCCGLDEDELRSGIGELVSAGLVASDGFAGLRALVSPSSRSAQRPSARAESSGRWFLLNGEADGEGREAAVERQARGLLRRYGVVFRRILTREANGAPWRELARVYRRLEARGEIRGGRFVAGMSGEQFALPQAVGRLREMRREGPDGRLVVISAADPLNLAGILTPGERIRAVAANRIAWRDGLPVSVMEGDYLKPLAELDSADAMEAATALAGRRVPVASGYVGRVGG